MVDGRPVDAGLGAPSKHAELARPFAALVFDWDGTAVMSRKDDASAVRGRLERLLELGATIAVVTGTNFPNIDRQLTAPMRGAWKQRLYACTNRGSEVYGFDAESRPVLLFNRVATPEEDRLLTEAAERTRERIRDVAKLDVTIIANRMNRRKIDLIPLPEWADPPKSAIGELLEAVQRRLRGNGFAGGLREVVELAQATAREVGLADARITSDVKHVEIGLTDKGDSIDWIIGTLGPRIGLAPTDVLVAGDEFGSIGGVVGSDAKMITPLSAGASYVSVGPEPGGTPAPVVHLGGGPPVFLELLDAQIAARTRAERAKPKREHEEAGAGPGEPWRLSILPAGIASPDQSWLLVENGFDLVREHEIESLMALSNGYAGVRGSLPEGSLFSSPRTVVAGVFDALPEGNTVALARLPDWTRVRVLIDNHSVRPDDGGLVAQRRWVDLRHGIFFRWLRHRDPAGRSSTVEGLRLVSLADRHLLLQRIAITAENYGAHMRLEARIEWPREVRAAPQHFASGDRSPTGSSLIDVRMLSTGMEVAMGVSHRLAIDGAPIAPRDTSIGERDIVDGWELDLPIGGTICLDRLVYVHTSREVEKPLEVVRARLARSRNDRVEGVIAEHARAWEEKWRVGDVVVEGDDASARALRFAAYHLLAAANCKDEFVSVGARALTGEAYHGHVFWDAELFMLPFYTYTHPRAARALLMYRYHTLPEARKNAQRFGCRGALYAWEAGWQGAESTPPETRGMHGELLPILNAAQEHHIDAAVAYGVWQYWRVTGDEAFFADAGAEILFETARFWASRCALGDDGFYHLRGVMGPDEYHDTVDDNAYTNVMAAWNLDRAVDAWSVLERSFPDRTRRLRRELGITSAEVESWRDIAGKIARNFNPASGLFEQFSGYDRLEDIDLAPFSGRIAPMTVLLGYDRIRRSKIIKQADVLMMVYLLGDALPRSVRLANYLYYEPRTDHGSSLSPPIHAALAARLGNLPLAYEYFRKTADVDLANNMGNAAGGVHAAALGGLWQAAVFGFGGVQTRDDHISIAPALPSEWKTLRFSIVWRGCKLDILADHDRVDVTLDRQAKSAVRVAGADAIPVSLAPGSRYVAQRREGQWVRQSEAAA